MKLLQGDARDIIGGLPIDYIIVTDPPFNIGYHYNEYKDRMSERDYMDMLMNIVGGIGAR